MSQTANGPPPGVIKPAVVVAICFVIAALEGYDIQALGVSTPALARALNLAKDQIGFAGSAAMIGLIIGAMFGGWLADRIGRKPVLVGAVAWFGIFSLATALTSDANTLMLARLAAGLGFGGAMPNMMAVAMEISAPGRRAATLTAMFAGLPVGGALVALVARFAAAAIDWRLIFIIGGLAPLAIAPLAVWLLPETRSTAEAGERRSLPALFGGGRAMTTLLLWLAFGFSLIVQYLMLSWLPTLALDKGLRGATAAFAAIWYNLGGVAGALAVGRLVDRVGYRGPLTVAYLGLAAAMAALAAATGASMILLLAGLSGFLMHCGLFSIYAMAPSYYPAPVRATGAGAAVGVGRLGAIAGPAIGGLLLAGGADAGQVVRFVIPLILAAGVAAVMLARVGKSGA